MDGGGQRSRAFKDRLSRFRRPSAELRNDRGRWYTGLLYEQIPIGMVDGVESVELFYETLKSFVELCTIRVYMCGGFR